MEGPDGSGKTHVAAAVRDALAERGIPARLTREPGGTAVGDRVRAILLEHAPDEPPLAPRADALLFAAARAQHVAEVIEPALARGEIVLCARYADSTLAYQGYGRGVDLDTLRRIIAIATDGLVPDRTILLDLPAEAGLGRKTPDSHTRFEAAFDVAFHQRVRAGFLEMAAREPERWVVIDADRDADAVFDSLVSSALEVLP